MNRNLLFALLLLLSGCSSNTSSRDEAVDTEKDRLSAETGRGVAYERDPVKDIASYTAIVDRNIKNYDSAVLSGKVPNGTIHFSHYFEQFSSFNNKRPLKLIVSEASGSNQEIFPIPFHNTEMECTLKSYFRENQLVMLEITLSGLDENDMPVLEGKGYFLEQGIVLDSASMYDQQEPSMLNVGRTKAYQDQMLNLHRFFQDHQPIEGFELTDTTEALAKERFVKYLYHKFYSDSIVIHPSSGFSPVSAEVFQRWEKKAFWYVFQCCETSAGLTGGQVELMGQHDFGKTAPATPGDFYYYLIYLSRLNDVATLKEHILPEGYTFSISDGNGENLYTEEGRVGPDTIQFEDLKFGLDLYANSVLRLSVDSAFAESRPSTVHLSAGGYYASLFMVKRGDKQYLTGYSFSGH